jgi:hypothetical protein
MAEPTLACTSYLSKYISHRMFSDMSSYRIASLLHRAQITMTSPPGSLPLKTYVFFPISRHMMELTVGFLLDETHLDPLSPGCKHGGQPLRPGHGFRSESWTRWQRQLVRCFQGKGAGHRQAIGVQWYEILVTSIYGSPSTWISILGLYHKFGRTDFPECRLRLADSWCWDGC